MLAAAGYPNGLDAQDALPQRVRGQSKTFQTVQQDLSKIGVKVVGVPSPERGLLHQVPPGADRRPARRVGPGRRRVGR